MYNFNKFINKISYLNLRVVLTAFRLLCPSVNKRLDAKFRQRTDGISFTATFSVFAMNLQKMYNFKNSLIKYHI